jgi:hypothetical protein
VEMQGVRTRSSHFGKRPSACGRYACRVSMFVQLMVDTVVWGVGTRRVFCGLGNVQLEDWKSRVLVCAVHLLKCSSTYQSRYY